MSGAYNYMFDSLSRIGNDTCGITARALQNSKTETYLTTNYVSKDCGMVGPIGFATKQPNIFYKGGVGSNNGAGGCGVNSETKLQRPGTKSNKHKCKLSLQQRSFLTVPFLGKGPVQPVLESKLKQGATITNPKKNSRVLMEKSFIGNLFTPMIPSLNSTIQNPANLIEDVAANGWIRGGLPTRELSREQDYLERKA
jgi:hypothetical protein